MSLPVHSTKLFTFDKEAKAFVAEISDVPRPVAATLAGVVGFPAFILMCEHGMGEQVNLVDEERCAETNDLIRWVFAPTTHDRYRVILFND